MAEHNSVRQWQARMEMSHTMPDHLKKDLLKKKVLKKVLKSQYLAFKVFSFPQNKADREEINTAAERDRFKDGQEKQTACLFLFSFLFAG